MSAMEPSLILRWAMTAGSRRVSLNEEAPPLLVGGLPPWIKLLTAAFRRYSSSTSRLFLFLMKRNIPPAIAAIATMPITTPAAIPALLGPEEDEIFSAEEVPVEELLAVTTTVCPPTVTTDGLAVLVAVDFPVALAVVADDVSDAEASALVTSYVKPVSQTL